MCKWLVPFIITPLIIPVSFFSLPQKIEAQAPAVPIAEAGPNFLTQIKNAAENTLSATKEYVLDNLTTVIAKTLIRQITQSTVAWINGGFKGSPAFIGNPEQFFTGIADRIAGDFIESIGFGFLCEPFRLDLRLSLALQYGGKNAETDLGCTFSDVLGNMEGFIEGDFTQGGWQGFFDVSQRQKNNPYGAYLQAQSALEIKIKTAQGTESLKLDWGGGFLSQEVCDDVDDYDNESGFASEDVRRSAQNCRIVTPGSVINDQLANVLGSEIRQLELADEINEIVGALVGQLVTQVMSATGLAGGSSGSSGGGYQTSQRTDPDFDSYITNAESFYGDQQENTGNSIEQDINSNSFQNFNDTNETGFFNLALGRGSAATQSGTQVLDSQEAFLASRAVDGDTNTNATQSNARAASTQNVPNPWWQVDLGEIRAVQDIRIFRETSISTAVGIGSIRIFLSNTPFTCESQFPYSCLFNGVVFDPNNPPQGVWASDIFTATILTQIPFSIDVNASGRFVRVQRVEAGINLLRMAEIEIYRNNAPVITLNGSNRITLRTGESYIEQNATAFDQSDADRNINAGVIPVVITITKDNTPVASVDTSVTGQYVVTYTATDSGGAVAKKSRQINVIENTN